ncbi:MAG TPA: insulinase family protein, partial [Gammaproteobacteria bacterium]|nr:insulinase family protein [Gammaproteobacteria bacterium]
EIDAALLAWRSPSSESRDSGWLALYCESRDIEVHARRVVGGVRLRVTAPAAERDSAIELLYLLLDRPMIDAGVFEQWRRSHAGEALEPLERALALLFNPAFAAANTEHKATLDDAQRALSRMARNASITVGIAGAIDAGDTIERAGTMLGELVARDASGVGDEVLIESTPGDRVCEIELQGHDAQRISGTLGGSLDSLDSLRATILASMVLHERARSAVKQAGLEADVDVQVVMSDSLGDRWAFLMRVDGPDEAAAIAMMNEAAEEMMSNGIAQDDLDRVKDDLDRSLARYTQSARYWSTRLSGVGLHGRTIEDIWSVRSGYASIDADTATDALRAALGSGDRFVIRMNSEPDR